MNEVHSQFLLEALSSFTVTFPFSDLSPALTPAFLQIKPFLGTLLGIFGALLLILSAIILVVRLKNSTRRDRTRASQISNTITMSSTLSPSLQNGILIREASADSIDKNPDIIPQGKKTRRGLLSLTLFSFVRATCDDDDDDSKAGQEASNKLNQHSWHCSTVTSPTTEQSVQDSLPNKVSHVSLQRTTMSG